MTEIALDVPSLPEISPSNPEAPWLQTLFEIMTLGVLYQDADGGLTVANPAAERMLGPALDHICGRISADPRWRALREDGTDMPAEEYPPMVALRTGCLVRDTVMGIYNPDLEETRWLRVGATPKFRAGEVRPSRVYAMFEDVTERHTAQLALEGSEQQLRLALESGGLGSWDLDLATGEFRTVSATLKALYGVRPDAEFTMSDRLRSVHPDDLALVQDGNDEATRTDHTVVAEFRIHWPDGSEHWLRFHNKAVHGGMATEHMIGASQDITEQKAVEATLREAVERQKTLLRDVLSSVTGASCVWSRPRPICPCHCPRRQSRSRCRERRACMSFARGSRRRPTGWDLPTSGGRT